jgi:hypothetical protein
MSGFLELRRESEYPIFAIPYRDGRPLMSVKLPEGTLVEAATTSDRDELPYEVADCFEVGHGGVPATRHHSSLGLVIAHLPFAGFFRFPDGGFAAVYGATAVPIRSGQRTAG